ncbi:MAG: tetratricopeptide repeat protein, partial [Verrucomicrobiota bacterium]
MNWQRSLAFVLRSGRVGELRSWVTIGALCLVVAPGATFAQSEAEEFAEVSNDRYVEPDKRLLLSKTGRNKSKALAGYYLGLSREKAGDVEGALEAYENVLTVSPEQLGLARRTAAMAGQFGETERGRDIMERAFERNQHDPAAFISLSEYLSTYHDNDKKNTERSIEIMEDAVEKFPDSPPTYDRVITMYLADRDRQKATETLTKALDRKNDDPYYWMAIAKVAQRIHSVGEEAGKGVINSLYEKALDLGPNDETIEGAVADYFGLTKQFDRARDLYERILEKRPEELTVREKLARIYRLLNDDEKALETLIALERINPHRLETQKFIADAYGQREEYAKAIVHWLKAFRLAKGTPGEYRMVARMMIYEGQGKEAVELLERAQFHYPDDLEMSVDLARAYNAADEYDQAFKTFKKTEDVLKQSRPELLDFGYYFSYGAAAERSQRFEEAGDLFRKSIDLVPQDRPTAAALPYNYLGYMWLEQDMNIDEAGELIILANELEPNSGAYVDSLGWFYFKKEDYPKALKTLLRSQKMIEAEEGFDPTDPE